MNRTCIVWCELWNRDSVGGQYTAQPRILFPQPLVLLVTPLE
ncbi:MAG: hypothetical protein ACYCPO_11900 [Acidobacteriaceae bacterium]